MFKRIFIILSYFAFDAAIVITTTVLVAYGQGYSYDFHTNKFSLNGLLVLDSTPQGADIKINGTSIHRKTPYRSTLEAGEYEIDITKNGYHDWHKKLSISASEVVSVPQIIMVPTALRLETLTTEANVLILVGSSDQRHFAHLSG